MHSTWRTQSDAMDDIWALSEMEGIGSREIEEPPPPTILEYRAQMAANNTGSVYDTPEFGKENFNFRLPGIGRGSFKMILQPGCGVSQLSDNFMTEDVQKRLRQVAGLGYSNALIEQGVRAMTGANDKNSPATSQTASPAKTSASYKTSGLCSPIKGRNTSSCSSTSSTPSHLEVIEDAGPPPPLSVMRKKAQEERAKTKQNASEETLAKKIDTSPTKKKNSPCNGKRSPWRSTSPGTSSDEGSWRKRDGNTANRFFKPRTNGFNLNHDEFPALK